jgi:hypothetical protein
MHAGNFSQKTNKTKITLNFGISQVFVINSSDSFWFLVPSYLLSI